MGNINILIVEDNFSFAIKLEMMLDRLGYQDIIKVESGEDALLSIASKRPSLILMDIDLKGELSGIDVGERICEEKIPIIFLTNFIDDTYFEKAKKVLPVAYLNKSFDETILKRTIQLAITNITSNGSTQPSYLIVKYGGKVIKLDKLKVIWVRADGNYCHIYTSNKRFIMKISLTQLKKEFPSDLFLQCHRNILVQLKKVTKIDKVANKLYLEELIHPVGSSYRKNVFKMFIGKK